MTSNRWIVTGTAPSAREQFARAMKRVPDARVAGVNAAFLIHSNLDLYGIFEIKAVEIWGKMAKWYAEHGTKVYSRPLRRLDCEFSAISLSYVMPQTLPDNPAITCGILMSLICAHEHKATEIHLPGFKGYDMNALYDKGLEVDVYDINERWCRRVNRDTEMWWQRITTRFHKTRFVMYDTPLYEFDGPNTEIDHAIEKGPEGCEQKGAAESCQREHS